MADKKYYWLKLQNGFFKRHDIRIVEAMPNGKDYILFYLKMLVESVSHNGELRFSEMIPYNEEMLSTITNTNVDIVRQAMKIFTELQMIEVLEDSTIFMAEVEKMIGFETDWARKKREYRASLEDKQRTIEDNVRQEKEKEIEKDKELEIEKDNKRKIAVYYPNDELLNSAFSDYVEMRKKIKAPMTPRAVELAIKKLDGMATDSDEKIAIVNQSIMNSWKGLFPLKEQQEQRPQSIADKWANI